MIDLYLYTDRYSDCKVCIKTCASSFVSLSPLLTLLTYGMVCDGGWDAV